MILRKRSRRRRKSNDNFLPLQNRVVPPDVIDPQTTEVDASQMVSYDQEMPASERLRRKLWSEAPLLLTSPELSRNVSRDFRSPDTIGFQTLRPRAEFVDVPCTCAADPVVHVGNTASLHRKMSVNTEQHQQQFGTLHVHLYNGTQTLRTFKDNMNIDLVKPSLSYSTLTNKRTVCNEDMKQCYQYPSNFEQQ